jgi:TolB protein
VFSSTQHSGGSDLRDHELYVINADGTGLTRLTFNNTYEYEPTWHPSGTEVAFVRNPLLAGVNPSILRMPVTPGAGATFVVSLGSETGTPAWSPDGTALAYTGSTGVGDNFRIDVYTTTAGRLTTCCDNKSPSWSPDGSEIAFEREGNIYRMRSDGSSRELVIQEPFPTHHPVWSPDGFEIAARWFGHGRIGV